MASGQIFGLTACPPGQLYAVEDTFAATTTATGGPYEVIPVWTFDAATAAYMDFYAEFEGLGTGGLELYYKWAVTSTATSGARFGAAIRKYTDGESIISAHTYSFQFRDDAGAGVAMETNGNFISFTATQTDSIQNQDTGVVRIYRDATATWDALTTNAYILQGGMVLKET